jgi:hypothetical protein
MSDVPENMQRRHLLKVIEEIDRAGMSIRAQSSSDDINHGGKQYPPKLLVAIANRFANGVELNRQSSKSGVDFRSST